MDGEAGAQMQALMRDAVRSEMSGMFEELRSFVDRRIAELSMEVSATEQLLDFSETNLSGQLQRMHEQIARVIAVPAAATRSSGIELEAIVQETEVAANRIMNAAEAIRANVAKAGVDANAIAGEINEIYEACSFQDLTSQRIKRALEHLQGIEGMLANMVQLSTNAPVERARKDTIKATAEITGAGPSLDQDDIDKLMANLT
ncbi:MAG TPA: hypothetical protein VET85_06315 [Stellaceae bacterium]|nr:hypothetical protein [Stellaceae bacterium]